MPEPRRQIRLWPWLILLVGSVGLGTAIGWQLLPMAIRLPSLQLRPLSPRPAPPAAPLERRRVRLFFPQETGGTLKEVDREIPWRPLLGEEVRAVLRELIHGEPGVRSPLPPAVEVRQAFLDSFGILYLDFNREIQSAIEAPGGEAELSVSALVNSLIGSLSEVSRVQFLVEGKELTGTAGRWDLHHPISPSFPGEEPPPVASPPQQ